MHFPFASTYKHLFNSETNSVSSKMPSQISMFSFTVFKLFSTQKNISNIYKFILRGMREKCDLPVWHKGLSQDRESKHEDTTVSLTGIHTDMIQELNRKRQSSSNSITDMTWNQA